VATPADTPAADPPGQKHQGTTETEAQQAAAGPSDGTLDPTRCRACRGSGSVISGLGGEPREVACPWCEGGGLWLADHDAQAAKSGQGQEGGAAASYAHSASSSGTE